MYLLDRNTIFYLNKSFSCWGVRKNCISFGGYVVLAALSDEEGGWQITTPRSARKRFAVMAEYKVFPESNDTDSRKFV